MDLSVPYSKAKTPQEAYDLACAQITPEYIDKFKVKAEIEYNKEDLKITSKGKAFSLELAFVEGETQVSIQLSLIFKAFKGQVLEGVERKLKNHV